MEVKKVNGQLVAEDHTIDFGYYPAFHGNPFPVSLHATKNPQSVTYTDDTYSVEIPATDAEENVAQFVGSKVIASTTRQDSFWARGGVQVDIGRIDASVACNCYADDSGQEFFQQRIDAAMKIIDTRHGSQIRTADTTLAGMPAKMIRYQYTDSTGIIWNIKDVTAHKDNYIFELGFDAQTINHGCILKQIVLKF